ncbi:hypothetical protein [Fluviicola sp.]|uniref:hypothetical protein n=1 Tax=Fluviicola sp. TaxID=1917219 RepID=UPI0031CF9474
MNVFKEKGFQGIVIILILIAGTIFYKKWRINSELNNGSRFTIIKVEKKQYFDNGDPMAHFYLKYENKTYDLGFTIDNSFNREVNEGDRLFIRFSTKDPTVFKIIDYPMVPKNTIAPENGWNSMPMGDDR